MSRSKTENVQTHQLAANVFLYHEKEKYFITFFGKLNLTLVVDNLVL